MRGNPVADIVPHGQRTRWLSGEALGRELAERAATWAHLVADCRSAGVHRAIKLTDALIAATAIEHGLPVVTQDENFDAIAGAHSRLVLARA